MTNDRVAELLREIEQLRNALQGRTVSCVFCNNSAKQLDAVRKALMSKQDECRALKKDLEQFRFAFSGEYSKSQKHTEFDGQKAVIYTRCSTRQQANQGDSIRRQLATCLQFAMQNGISICDIYCDAGLSGYDPNALTQRNMLLDRWGREPSLVHQTLVLVESLDRWARTPSVFDKTVELVECSKGLWMQP